MGLTKAQLEEKNRELRARVKNLEEDNSRLADRNRELAGLLELETASRISANNDANDQRAKVAELKKKLEQYEPKPDRSNLSPSCQSFLEEAEKNLRRDTIISTDDIIRTATPQAPDGDTRFLDSFMANVEKQSKGDMIARNRSYIELNPVVTDRDDDDDDVNADDCDGCEDACSGAPHGRSASGEYLDPDEEED